MALLCEDGSYLLQEDGGLILLEGEIPAVEGVSGGGWAPRRKSVEVHAYGFLDVVARLGPVSVQTDNHVSVEGLSAWAQLSPLVTAAADSVATPPPLPRVTATLDYLQMPGAAHAIVAREFSAHAQLGIATVEIGPSIEEDDEEILLLLLLDEEGDN
jgi:hypothetical protein